MVGSKAGGKEIGKERMWEGLREGREKKGQADDPRPLFHTTFLSGMGLRPVGRREESGLVLPRAPPLQGATAAAPSVRRTLLLSPLPLGTALGTPGVLTRRGAGLAGELSVLLV